MHFKAISNASAVVSSPINVTCETHAKGVHIVFNINTKDNN
jgi:hypothetical protein